MEGKIAIEEHFSTPLNNNFWDAKGEASRNGVAYTQDIERRLLDPAAHLAEMDRAGIEISILSLTSPGIQGIEDPKTALDVARDSNDYAARIVQKYPNRFRSFAAVPLQDPEAAAAELERGVKSLGLAGALINGYSTLGANECVQYLDEEPVRVFWSKVSELNVPVYLHPREPLPSQYRSVQGYPELGGSAWAFGYETGSHAIRLMLSGVFDEFPNLRIILGHLGEGLPFLLPRLQHRLDEQREGERGAKAARRPSFYLVHNFCVTTSGHFHTRPLLESIEVLGADNVLFAVDYPYEQTDVAGRWFDDMLLSPEIKRTIGRENAKRIFSLR